MGRRATTDGVKPAGDRIEVRFTWKGKDLRPTLPLKPTAANLKHAVRLRQDILDDIRTGCFILAKYFPDYKFADRHVAPSATGGRTLREWEEVWAKLSTRDLEHSTLSIYRRHLKAYWLPKLGDTNPARVTHEAIRLHLADLSHLSRKTQNNILIPFRGVMSLVCKTLKIEDPTEGIDNLKVQRPDPDPFTPEEVELILTTWEKKDPVFADYFEFAFFAGLRVSEQIALMWPDVDLVKGTMLIHRAKVLTKDKERTKTHRARLVELNSRALEVLKRQKARTYLAGKEVFMNHLTGRPWLDEQVQWDRWTAVLKLIGVRHRPPKECRDTSVTMNLQAGANPVWVSNQHGHSLQVMMTRYAKWIPNADRGVNLSAMNRSIDLSFKKAV